MGCAHVHTRTARVSASTQPGCFRGAGCHSPALPALRVPGHGSWVLAAAQGRNSQRPSSPSAERSGETPRHSQKCSEHSQKRSGYRRLKPEVPGERSPRWRVSCSRLVALVTRLPSAASRWGWHPRAGWVQHRCSRGTWKPPWQPSACAGCWLQGLQSTAQRCSEIWLQVCVPSAGIVPT